MQSAKKFLGLGMVVGINLALQFLFQWFIITSFGAGAETDIFFGAMALPQFILLVLSSTLTIVLIPLISKYKDKEFLSESWNYFQGAGILFGAIALLLFLTAQWWVKLMLPGFKGEASELALNLSRIQLLSMLLTAMLSVLWAIHSARENFYLIEFTSILATAVALVFMYFSIGRIGIYSPAWAAVLKILLQLFLLIRILGPYRKLQISSPSFKLAWKKLKFLVAGNLYYKLDDLVDRNLTSRGISGQLTLLNLAQQLYGFANNVLNKVLIQTLMPSQSLKAHEQDWKGFYSAYKKRLSLLALISVGVYLLLLFAGKPVLAYIFSFKNFTTDNVNLLWSLMIMLFGVWFGGLMGSLTSGTFYAKGDTKTPTLMSAILFTVYVPVKIYCFMRFGITGLALSTSIYMMISLFIQMFLINRSGNKVLKNAFAE